ncbi:MAG: DUF2188 domain-containing protein [Candidatus Saccharibacteria bacterium]|nr:DUF2188 domain-containing protein [Candidatus Saccharibacteria bacterium]
MNHLDSHNGKGWYVRKADVKTNPNKLFNTKNEALASARKDASKHKSEIFVFNNKGTLLERENPAS